MTEAERAALWRQQQEAREAYVATFRDALEAAPSPLADEIEAGWEPRLAARRERHETDELPDDPNIWEPE